MPLQGHGRRIMGTGFGSVGFRLNDCESTTRAEGLYARSTNTTKTTIFSTTIQQWHWWTTVQSTTVSPRSTRRDFGKRRQKDPEAYPEIEPPEDEREGRPALSKEKAMESAVSKRAAKPSDPEQRMAVHSETLMEMQKEAKRRRAKQLEKETKRKGNRSGRRRHWPARRICE